MTNFVPFNEFARELSAEETILWTGQPNSSVVLHPDDSFMIPFSLLWGGFAIFWTLGATGASDIWANKPDHAFRVFGLIWGTPFVVVGQYLIWGRFLHARWKKRRTYYALTNRRALIVEHGLRSRLSTSAYFTELEMIGKRVRSDGIGCIAFGGPVMNEWGSKHRPPPPPTFEDVDDVESVYRIVEQLRSKAAKS